MNNDMAYVLYTEEQIQNRVKEMGAAITEKYAGTEPVFVGILKGSFVFMADLMRAVNLKCSVDFMAVSSYGNGSVTTGAVKINKDLSQDIEGKHLVIVEDILDSGVTLSYLIKYLENRYPASISIYTLLDKPERRKRPVKTEMSGFVIPDAFVVGYGLDYAEKYRNLPYIGVLKPEIYSA
ncbi:MAG: hypoxanthine phosphoribosyltransferase [Candidatus Heteroscillospira sp.]|jgi:hypoxanthine phosphoribosyltransferase